MSEPDVSKKATPRHGPPIPSEGWMRIVGFLIFFLVFFSAIFLFELYALTRLFAYLSLDHGWLFLAFVALSSLSFIIAMGLRTTTSSFVTKGYYYATAAWLGFLIYLLFASFVYDVLNRFVSFPDWVRLYVLIGGTVFAVALSLAIPYVIKRRFVEVPAKRLKTDVKIVHLTDIHVGATHGPEHLKELVGIANEMQPDLVLITGDLADSPLDWSENPFSVLDELKAPAYFTIGNHEYYAGIEEVTGLLAKTKVRVLRNEVAQANGVQILGLDYGNAKDLGKILPTLAYDRSKYTILMYHNPDGLEVSHEGGIDLILSGHTHGGQFFPFTVFGRLIWKTFHGLYEHEGTYHWVSSGAGTWGPPMRMGTRSEVTLLRLKSDGDARPASKIL